MILGLGIDLVQVSRFDHWLSRPGLLERYFYPDEINDIRNKGSEAVLSLAGRFAAKEAFGKALGTGLRKLALRDIQVINDKMGKPDIRLHKTAEQLFQENGGERILLSLSHERDQAVAIVIIEGE